MKIFNFSVEKTIQILSLCLNFQFINRFSFKQIKAAVKEDESILLGKKSKSFDVGRAIYELVQSGVKGVIKKDVLLAAITDLTVSVDVSKAILHVFKSFT